MKKGMTIREFLHREEVTFLEKAKRHIQRNKSFYITAAGYTVFFICASTFDASAASSLDIDRKATAIYKKLVSVGKWVVIIKAAFDVVQTATSGDLPGVKTKLIGYLIVFLTLLGLPWAFEEIQGLFQDSPVNG